MSAKPKKSTEARGLALILDDEPGIVMVLEHLLKTEGWEVLTASRLTDARSLTATRIPDLAVVDVYLDESSGLDFVRELRQRDSETGILVISSEDTSSLAMKAIESGADYFVSKPISPPAFLLSIRNVFSLREERGLVRQLRSDLESAVEQRFASDIITQSDVMKGVLQLVKRAAAKDIPVLISGESGTGKELVARAIHANSNRRNGNFVEVNCAALPANLVESELFGHEKGAFTGAISSRQGCLARAHKGTLFLDEIGELPLEVQPKLLRALQEKRFNPVGSTETKESDFRLVCATNRDLVKEVKDGRFREDLYFRVAVVAIRLPALRERPEDLRLLLDHFLRQEGQAKMTFTQEANGLLATYNWPGNVRELRNFAQALTVFVDAGTVNEEDIRNCLGSRLDEGGGVRDAAIETSGNAPIRNLEALQEMEMRRALRWFRGNATEAAKALGIGRSTLYRFIQREDIDLEALKNAQDSSS